MSHICFLYTEQWEMSTLFKPPLRKSFKNISTAFNSPTSRIFLNLETDGSHTIGLVQEGGEEDKKQMNEKKKKK